MRRCLELAAKGAGYVAPNPMVGSVLVYNDRIIGEGWHERYGEAHAEVNCIRSVKEEDRPLIPQSTLYVSLEPCAHYGKTPPCADLVIREGIKKVVVATRDPFDQVNGKGIEKLRNAGVEVVLGVCEMQAREQNRRFFHFHTLRRPYVVLKWACSLNNAIATGDKKPVAISCALTNRLVHQWRAEESAILIGANTGVIDNPSLTVRLVNGKNPVRLLLDSNLRVPLTHKIYNDQAPTIVYNVLQEGRWANVELVRLDKGKPLLGQVMQDAWKRKLLSILVEGGARTHEQFLREGYADELRRIQSRELIIYGGYPAPAIGEMELKQRFTLGKDEISIFAPQTSRL